MEKAIVLLSGGLDSATTLGVALEDGYECYPIAFDYSQRHKKELMYPAKIVNYMGGKGKPVYTVKIITIIGLDFSTSALTSDLGVPKNRDEKEMGASIPVTYVPARNSIFLSIGTAFAEAIEASRVYAGFNAVDYSGYPDCRPEYVEVMEQALSKGTKRGVSGNPIKLCTPIIKKSKKDIVELAYALDVPLQYTWSCYVGQDTPCGACDSCIIRAKAFADLGKTDPALEQV
jgi:7-cyano-7-deazaguanine synthase